MLDAIERARRYIAKCPSAVSGQGGHNATFHVAAVLVHGFALPETDALELMRGWNLGCVPPWSDSELVHKIRSASSTKSSEPRGHLLGPSARMRSRTGKKLEIVPAAEAKPVFNPAVLKRVASKARAVGNVFEFVRSISPINVEGETSASFLERLYPASSGEKVVIFSEMRSQGQLLWESGKGMTGSRLPQGSEGVWFLPQPVSGEYLPNPRLGGKLSRRSEESITSWRYMVLESDKANAEDWLRCLIQMPLRITSICESGGRSIHALVRLDAESKEDWDKKVAVMKPALITLGADPGALSAVRLTRLPQARRGDRLQRLLYLHPASEGRALYVVK